MNIEIQELLQAVENINTDLYKQLGDDTAYILWVTLEPAAGYQCIEWMGDTIWHSEDDNREYIEDYDEFKGDYEPIEPFLRKKVMEVVNEMKKIQL